MIKNENNKGIKTKREGGFKMKYQYFNDINAIETKIAVTITVDTHNRADPKNNQDRIVLKNEINYARKRLLSEYDKREVWPIIEQLEKLEEDIDHSHNTEGLVLFASENFSDIVRLPFKPGNAVEIDQKFATRSLIRAVSQAEHYYILCLSLTEIRLVEAYNDILIGEFKNEFFPFLNDEYYTTDRMKNSFSDTQEKYLKEFFNVADKKFHEQYKVNPLPVILAGTEKNLSYFIEKTSDKANIIGQIRGNFDDRDGVSLHELVELAADVLKEYQTAEYLTGLDEMEAAEGGHRLVTDILHVYQAVKEGRVQKLFVEKDYFQSAKILENGELQLVDEPYGEEIIDDVINEFIYTVLQFGGDVVFLPSHYIGRDTKIAAILRW